jgi:hypothetical protein
MSPTPRALRDIGFIDAAKKGQLFVRAPGVGPSSVGQCLGQVRSHASRISWAEIILRSGRLRQSTVARPRRNICSSGAGIPPKEEIKADNCALFCLLAQRKNGLISVMADTSEDNSVLRAAIDGIARVAEAIDNIPEDQQKRALEAAEISYRQTVGELNYPEDIANSWVTAMMYTLTTEVKKISRARRDSGHDASTEPVS